MGRIFQLEGGSRGLRRAPCKLGVDRTNNKEFAHFRFWGWWGGRSAAPSALTIFFLSPKFFQHDFTMSQQSTIDEGARAAEELIAQEPDMLSALMAAEAELANEPELSGSSSEEENQEPLPAKRGPRDGQPIPQKRMRADPKVKRLETKRTSQKKGYDKKKEELAELQELIGLGGEKISENKLISELLLFVREVKRNE